MIMRREQASALPPFSLLTSLSFSGRSSSSSTSSSALLSATSPAASPDLRGPRRLFHLFQTPFGEGIRLFRSRWRQGLRRVCLPSQVHDELVERVPLPGLRRREGLKGIGEILMVRAVHRC
jgi:hypothetical protein